MVDLASPPKEVWEVISAPDRYADWLVSSMLGMPGPRSWSVVDARPPRQVTITATGLAGVQATYTFTVEPRRDDASAIIVDAGFEGTSALGAMGTAVAQDADGNLAVSLQRLSALVTGVPQPTPPGLTLDEAGIGVWSEKIRFDVTRERLAAYAAAVNDPIAAHGSGDLANPVFAVVPGFDALLEPLFRIVPTSLVGRMVHGEQELRFHRPIRPADELVSRARMTGFEGAPNGTRVCTHLETCDAAGRPVVEAYVTSFIRGFDAGLLRGELLPGHRLDGAITATAPTWECTQHVDADQTFRYADASGDRMPIHLDEQVARELGLPGIILHGLCGLASVSSGLLQAHVGSDSTRLRRLAVRFARPVLPEDDIHTRAWRLDGGAYGFESDVSGSVVLRNGFVEIAETGTV